LGVRRPGNNHGKPGPDMTTYLKLDVEASAGLPAVSAGRSASENLRSIIRFLKGFPEARQGTVMASIPGGTKASGTLTCASVANGNTAVVNGVTMTAAQKHATGTLTPQAAVVAADTCAISGVTFTAVANDATAAANQFKVGAGDGSHASFTAGELTAAINASTSTEIASIGFKVANNTLNGETITVNGRQLTFASTLNPAVTNQIQVAATAALSAVNAAAAINEMVLPQVVCAALNAGDYVIVDGVTFTARAAPNTSGYEFLLDAADNANQAQLLAKAVAAKRADLLVTVALGGTVRFKRRGTATPLVVTSNNGSRLAVTGVGPAVTATASGDYVLFSTYADHAPSFAGSDLTKTLPCGFTATASGATVTVRARMAGAGGNAALSETNGRINRSGANMTNGAVNADAAFCFTGSNTQVALDIARALAFSSDVLVLKQIDVSPAEDVVTVTAKHAGVLGNAITLAGSGNVTASEARLTGGTETDALTMAF